MTGVVPGPVVSVVTPCFNGERFLRETIAGVQAQTLTDWEWIIVDDGSTDATAEVVREYLDDPRIRYYRKENSGVSDTRNFGMARARGRYVALLDADDVWTPRNLEEKVGSLERAPDAMWCYSDMVAFTEQTGEEALVAGSSERLLERYLLHEDVPVPGPCSNIVFRRTCLDGEVAFDPRLTTSADRDFVTQLSRQFRHVHVPGPLWRYRVSAGSMSTNVGAIERDHVYMLRKYRKMGLLSSARFRRRCVSNHYMVIAGSLWVHSSRKGRALRFLMLALLNHPPAMAGVLRRVARRLIGDRPPRG